MSEGGILAIKGVKSQYYICMNKAGQLQGKVILLVGEKSHMLFFRLHGINGLLYFHYRGSTMKTATSRRFF